MGTERTGVANMASYAISSSLILVIHDNMINGTNHIVTHIFVDISRSQGCKNTTCQNEKKIVEEKEKKGHRRKNRRYLDSKRRCNGSIEESRSCSSAR
jgi:hypothetical protein